MPQVRYIHPINGVYEKALSSFDSNKKEKANFYDMGGNPLVNNDIKELRIGIVGNAGKVDEKLKYILDEADNNYKLKNYQEAVWSYMTDHENYVLLLKDTDMRTALILMTPKGVVTHQNGLFGSSVYNMETQIRLSERKFRNLDKKKPEESRSGAKGGNWCRGQIEQYGKYMRKALENEDQGLCSYCQAIIQTLNTLAQFGEFELSRNIFYIIYPAFKLFSEQLDSVCNDFEDISRNPNKRKIQKAMRDFLDSVNSIMYHAIHMDQIFLMIPGCSGTSFSIPTKLSLFYLWFLNRVSKILNDTSNKYAFYLTPVMESKPCTYPIEFGLSSDKDRLVCVKVSQRSLYIPGELLIILTHEMAHYVGKEIRCRDVRWRKAKETMAALIAEAIIPFWCMKNENSLRTKYKKIYMYVSEELQNRMDFVYALKYEQETLYHVAAVSKILKDECARILADENGGLMKIITSRADDDKAEDVPFNEMMKLVEEEDRISGECNRRRIGFLGKGDCDRIIDMLLREYQEIFADAAAFAILQFERDDYSYAYNISEGYKVDELCMPNKDYNRKRLLFEEYTGKERSASEDMGDGSQERDFEEKDLIEYWSNLDFVQNQMREYISECKTKMKKRFKMPDTQKYITKIREAYLRFSTSKFSCRQIYSTINDNAAEYAKEIQKQLDDSQL